MLQKTHKLSVGTWTWEVLRKCDRKGLVRSPMVSPDFFFHPPTRVILELKVWVNYDRSSLLKSELHSSLFCHMLLGGRRMSDSNVVYHGKIWLGYKMWGATPSAPPLGFTTSSKLGVQIHMILLRRGKALWWECGILPPPKCEAFNFG